MHCHNITYFLNPLILEKERIINNSIHQKLFDGLACLNEAFAQIGKRAEIFAEISPLIFITDIYVRILHSVHYCLLIIIYYLSLNDAIVIPSFNRSS